MMQNSVRLRFKVLRTVLSFPFSIEKIIFVVERREARASTGSGSSAAKIGFWSAQRLIIACLISCMREIHNYLIMVGRSVASGRTNFFYFRGENYSVQNEDLEESALN